MNIILNINTLNFQLIQEYNINETRKILSIVYITEGYKCNIKLLESLNNNIIIINDYTKIHDFIHNCLTSSSYIFNTLAELKKIATILTSKTN